MKKKVAAKKVTKTKAKTKTNLKGEGRLVRLEYTLTSLAKAVDTTAERLQKWENNVLALSAAQEVLVAQVQALVAASKKERSVPAPLLARVTTIEADIQRLKEGFPSKLEEQVAKLEAAALAHQDLLEALAEEKIEQAKETPEEV